jgi:type II secretory pathway pseudopilin PulG
MTSECPSSNRDGFTIAEVLLALLLLSFMVMGFQAATGEIIHYAAQSDRKAVAVQLVQSRINLIRLDPRYTTLPSTYKESGTTFPDHPGLTRTTVPRRTLVTGSTGVLDYTTITVTVDGAGLRDPVSRTIVVGAP